MLMTMIREFIAICNYLEKNNAKKVKGFWVIGRRDLEQLLDKLESDEMDRCGS